MDQLTLTAILTTAGSVAAAALITGLIGILKALPTIGPIIDADREPLASFVLSALLVILAVVNAVANGSALSIEFLFAAFLGWYAIAKLSMGVHDDLAKPAATALTERRGGAGG